AGVPRHTRSPARTHATPRRADRARSRPGPFLIGRESSRKASRTARRFHLSSVATSHLATAPHRFGAGGAGGGREAPDRSGRHLPNTFKFGRASLSSATPAAVTLVSKSNSAFSPFNPFSSFSPASPTEVKFRLRLCKFFRAASRFSPASVTRVPW